MAQARSLDSYALNGGKLIIKPGDTVYTKSSMANKKPYLAKLEKIEGFEGGDSQVKVHVQLYYRPEMSIGGRRQFHGIKEVFLSDHRAVLSADVILGKCSVHTLKAYTKLNAIGIDDYFCRFSYNSATGAFKPDVVRVYCKCEMPFNPDDLMMKCEGCKDLFHPRCVGMTIEEAKKLPHCNDPHDDH